MIFLVKRIARVNSKFVRIFPKNTFHAYGDLKYAVLIQAKKPSSAKSEAASRKSNASERKAKKSNNQFIKMTDETNFCKEIDNDNNKNKNSVRCQFCNSIILKPNSANYSENEVNVVRVRVCMLLSIRVPVFPPRAPNKLYLFLKNLKSILFSISIPISSRPFSSIYQ